MLVGYVAVACLGAMTVGLFAPEALRVLVARSYHPEAASIPALLLAFAAVALGAYTVTSIGIGLALKTPLLGIAAWAGALAAGLAHLAFTPRLGPPGAALATLAGYVSVACLTFALAQRVRPMPYRGGAALALFGLALGLAFAAQRFAPQGIAGVAVRAAAIVLYAAVCWRMRVWTERTAVAAVPGGD